MDATDFSHVVNNDLRNQKNYLVLDINLTSLNSLSIKNQKGQV